MPAEDSQVQIVSVVRPQQIEECRKLFQEYAEWLPVDLCFQGFTAELAGLPGAYAAPRGRLLLAMEGSKAAGCAGLRALSDLDGELKRFYVRPQFRGRGVGSRLARLLLEEARAIGYAAVFLDTLPTMGDAIRLYERLGFKRCPPYYQTPVVDTVFMKLDLKPS